MPCCSAVGCRNRTNGGVKLYRFPANRERQQIWKNKVSRKGWEPTLSWYLCQACGMTFLMQLLEAQILKKMLCVIGKYPRKIRTGEFAEYKK